MKTLVLIFSLTVILYAFTHDSLVKIYENHFDKNRLYEVKEIEKHYFIINSTPFMDRQAQKQLILLSKALLLRYYQTEDKNITGLELKEFKKGLTWKKDSRLFMLCYIEKNNIKKTYTKADNTMQNIIHEEIQKFENIKDKNLTIHQQLKGLYFQNGNFEKYNQEMDLIMEMKFDE